MTNKFDRIHTNTNKKCVIRNCPSYIGEFEREYSCGNETNELFCQDCTDCVMKQIVEKCIDEINYSDRWSESRAFAEEILQLLQIEDVE